MQAQPIPPIFPWHPSIAPQQGGAIHVCVCSRELQTKILHGLTVFDRLDGLTTTTVGKKEGGQLGWKIVVFWLNRKNVDNRKQIKIQMRFCGYYDVEPLKIESILNFKKWWWININSIIHHHTWSTKKKRWNREDSEVASGDLEFLPHVGGPRLHCEEGIIYLPVKAVIRSGSLRSKKNGNHSRIKNSSSEIEVENKTWVMIFWKQTLSNQKIKMFHGCWGCFFSIIS